MPTLERERDEPIVASPPKNTTPNRSWRPLILRLHFYAGLLVAPFILIAAITGAVYAVMPTVEQWVYSDYIHTDARGTNLSVADQVHAAQALRPDLTLNAVRPAPTEGDTTRVMFTDPSLGESERRAVFIDPVTGQSHGELVVYGSSNALPLRTWIDQLHRNLHLGEPGRLYSELAASWLWVITLGGLALWADRYRRMRHRGNARLATVDRATKGRSRTLNWHGAVGLWIAAGLLFLSVTGLTWSTYAGKNIGDLRSAMSWNTPSVTKTLTPSTQPTAPDEHADHGGGMTMPAAATPVSTVDQIDTVLRVAHSQGVDGNVEVAIPSSAKSAFVVAQTRQPWMVSPNTIAIDGSTGAIIDRLWFADYPFAAKLTTWGIALHMGILFGLPNQIALFALMALLISVIMRGYLMWWKRRPTRGGAPRPPTRGTWRALPVPSVIGVLAVAAVVGWYVPLLGLPLLGFLLLDAAIGVVNFARARA